MRRRRMALTAWSVSRTANQSEAPPPCTLLFHFALAGQAGDNRFSYPPACPVPAAIRQGPNDDRHRAGVRRSQAVALSPASVRPRGQGETSSSSTSPTTKRTAGKNLPFFKYLLPSVSDGDMSVTDTARAQCFRRCPRPVLGRVHVSRRHGQRRDSRRATAALPLRRGLKVAPAAGTPMPNGATPEPFSGFTAATTPPTRTDRHRATPWRPGPAATFPSPGTQPAGLQRIHAGVAGRLFGVPWHPAPPAASAKSPSPAEPVELPRLSIIIPTIGRATLARTLATIAAQDLLPGDEVLVIGDGRQPEAERIFAASGLPGRYLDGPERHNWGGATYRGIGPGPRGTSWPSWMMTTCTRPGFSPPSARPPIATP